MSWLYFWHWLKTDVKHADSHGVGGSNKMWDMPVRERLHNVATLAKQLLGPRSTNVTVRMDKQYLDMRICVHDGRKGKVSRLNFQLLLIIVEEALDMWVCAQFAKGDDLHVHFRGTLARAADAKESSPRRKRRRQLLAWSSYALLCFACVQFCHAVHVMWEDKCSDPWDEYARLAGFYRPVCQRTCANALRAAGCVVLLHIWILYHFVVQHTPMGPVTRYAYE